LINFFLLRIVRPFFALLGMKLVPPCCLICRKLIAQLEVLPLVHLILRMTFGILF